MRFFNYLQNMDRRLMYLFLLVVLMGTIYGKWFKQTMPATPEVQGVYDTIDHIQKHKIVILSCWWSAGTIAENRPQTEVIVRHLFAKGIPFAILPWDQNGTTLAYNEAKRISDEMHKTYGKDWISLGWQTGAMPQIVNGLGTDIQGTLKKDRNGTPLGEIPMMKGITSAKDIGLVVEITPSGTVGGWISYLCGPKKVKLAYAPTGVMAPEGYNFLQTGQIVGMLPGVIGAAKYETLLKEHGIISKTDFATSAANALSTSHLLIIVLIILGNVGYFVTRQQMSR